MEAPLEYRTSSGRARGASQNGVWARAATASQKKAKKRSDDDEIRTHAILEGFNPYAERTDCYVSHFLTCIAGTSESKQD